MKELAEKFHKRKQLVLAFERLTHLRIGRFLNPILGFDIVAFDSYLQVPDGTSTRDFVEKKYGKEAIALVEELLK